MSGAISQVFRSLSSVPLGADDNEQSLTRPFNAAAPDVEIFVRNWSAIKPRRIVKEFISFRRGGIDAIKRGPYKGTGVSLQELRERAMQNYDVNWYSDNEVVEENFVLRFDGKGYVIPARDADGGVAPETKVPQGVYDLYCGNYERLHSDDPTVRSEEISRLNMRVNNLRCEGPEDDSNPSGVLQFIRRPIPMALAASPDRVYAQDVTEV